MSARLGAVLLAAAWPAGAAGETHVLAVGGLGGEPAYEERFARHVQDLAEAGRALAGDPSRVSALSGPAATRDAIRDGLAAIARTAGPDDVVVAAFVGHGTVDGTVYKFNVPGPDPTCDELKEWLDRVPARRQLVVLATSASGACLGPLARDGRVVLSATRSGSERNAPVFARYFVEALRDPAADRDRDETVTALEAFRYTEQKVKRFYEDAKRLATEHPMASAGADVLARHVLARRGAAALRAQAGGVAPELSEQIQTLEEEIQRLKARKSSMERQAYFTDLERLLLSLARLQESIDLGGS